MLLGRRQARVQRQHLDIAGGSAIRGPDGFCGVADLPFAGEKDQHVTGWLRGKFRKRIDDGLGLIAGLDADDLVVGIVGIGRLGLTAADCG